MEGRLVEECTLIQLTPSLEKLAKSLKSDARSHDMFVALSTVIMGEAGFRLVDDSRSTHRLETGDSETLDPGAWRSPQTGCYELRFEHDSELLDCKIVGVPVGDVIIINLCSLSSPNGEQRTARCAAFQILKYVNPYAGDLAGRFMNLRELSHRFKDSLTTPMKGEILTDAGITNPSLAGLPTEIKLRVLKLLDDRAISRVAKTSRKFREICGDQRLRRRTYERTLKKLKPDGTRLNYGKNKHAVSVRSYHVSDELRRVEALLYAKIRRLR